MNDKIYPANNRLNSNPLKQLTMKKSLSFLLFLFICLVVRPQNKNLTAGQVVDHIKKKGTTEWSKETVDTFKSGGEETKITGIATTFLANLDVLQRAKEPF